MWSHKIPHPDARIFISMEPILRTGATDRHVPSKNYYKISERMKA